MFCLSDELGIILDNVSFTKIIHIIFDKRKNIIIAKIFIL